MSVRGIIEDGQGSGREATVTNRRALLVQLTPDTSIGLAPEVLTSIRLSREYFSDSAGSVDINVDGSVSPVQFDVSAEVGQTKWVTGFKIQFEAQNMNIGASQEIRRFGNASGTTGLAVGLEIFTVQSGERVDIVIDPAKSTGDLISYGDTYLNFVDAVSANVDMLQINFSFDKPVVLPDGSNDRVVFQVNDDLTPLDLFRVVARGYKESTT